jgi:hypothetical protein
MGLVAGLSHVDPWNPPAWVAGYFDDCEMSADEKCKYFTHFTTNALGLLWRSYGQFSDIYFEMLILYTYIFEYNKIK